MASVTAGCRRVQTQLPEIEEPEPARPKANRSKTTLFVSIANAQVEKARKAIISALDKAKIVHSL